LQNETLKANNQKRLTQIFKFLKNIIMKKHLVLLILLSCIYNLSNARNWDMLKSGKRWNMLQVSETNLEWHNDSSTYYVKFDEDTIINTLTYRRVFRATDTEFTDKTLNGYVREDSTVGLYFRNLQGEEGLLYKYNLHLGDSVFIQNKSVSWLANSRYLVTGIDSILINGRYIKKYIMTEKYFENWPETWVEGVGSSIGILSCGVHTVGGWTSFLCCYDNNVLMYKNPDFQNCYYNSTRTALHQVSDSGSGINVWSGTVPNEVLIKSQVDNSIRIFNCYGMFVETVHVLANQEYRLNVLKYPKGIYIISPSTNLSGLKKFIIH